MNPLAAGLRQPDARSCGAASLVMARLLRDGVSRSPAEFRDDVLTCHRRLTRCRDARRWQLPWPRALGTPPWAVQRELEQVTGRDHDVRLARWSRKAAYERLTRTGGVLYVGSGSLPRHVLLVLPPAAAGSEACVRDTLTCYQPSRGDVVGLPRHEFLTGRLQQAGWPHAWFTISPAKPIAPAAHPPPPR